MKLEMNLLLGNWLQKWLVDIDPKIQPLTFGKKKKKILGLIPGSRIIEKIINSIFFEFDSSNKVLWLYKP